ncbi:MAG: type II toxin-antitoxin system RatA family toxin [Hyphomicrobium sp.]|nr:type II toxin-antitoxin system RatA family toxin [Hyphomicrobium sp.]
MPSFRTTRRVPFTAAEMFVLVADVERYPEFVPLCESLTVTSRSGTTDDGEIVATMGIGYKAIRERFTTRVRLSKSENLIVVQHVDGPFRRLENRWTFRDVAGGSDVGFEIDYEFRSIPLGLIMGAVFDKAFRRFAEAFEERARAIYGARPGVLPA